MKLRIGVIGLGDVWQQRHAPALRMLADRFEVRAVCDQVAHRAQQAAAEFHAAAVDGFRALACREDLDAVLILSLQWYGALPILAACESGKAVYCAAGLDLSLEEAELVKTAGRGGGDRLHGRIPSPSRLGHVAAEGIDRHPAGTAAAVVLPSAVGGRHASAQAASPLAAALASRHLVELVDWCRYVVDRDARRVFGVMHAGKSDRAEEDYQMMSLDFSDPGMPASGPVAQISCGRYVPPHWQEAITYRPLPALQVSCERGIAFVDLPSTLVWFDEAGRHQESLESERPVGEQLLTQFHRAVTSLVRKTMRPGGRLSGVGDHAGGAAKLPRRTADRTGRGRRRQEG